MKFYLLLKYRTRLVSALLLLCSIINAQDKVPGVSILQNGKEITVNSDTQTVVLKKEEFKILFNSYGYSDGKRHVTHFNGILYVGE